MVVPALYSFPGEAPFLRDPMGLLVPFWPPRPALSFSGHSGHTCMCMPCMCTRRSRSREESEACAQVMKHVLSRTLLFTLVKSVPEILYFAPLLIVTAHTEREVCTFMHAHVQYQPSSQYTALG